jgi:hypothetical protein
VAVGSGHFELAAFLLDRGADANAAPQGWTALHQLTWVRKTGVAGSNNPPPQGSGTMSSLELARRLIAHGANPDARVTRKPPAGITRLNFIGGTAFLLAARTADADYMRLLASLGANPRLPNADESTPLIVAAGLGTAAPGEDPGTEPEVLEAVKVALELATISTPSTTTGKPSCTARRTSTCRRSWITSPARARRSTSGITGAPTAGRRSTSRLASPRR